MSIIEKTLKPLGRVLFGSTMLLTMLIVYLSVGVFEIADEYFAE